MHTRHELFETQRLNGLDAGRADQDFCALRGELGEIG